MHLSFFQRELAGTWEIRRGELLGPAEAGANQHSLALLASNASDLERTLRHRLRALAKAKPRLPELLATATDAEDGTARLAADGDHAPIVPPGSRSGKTAPSSTRPSCRTVLDGLAGDPVVDLADDYGHGMDFVGGSAAAVSRRPCGPSRGSRRPAARGRGRIVQESRFHDRHRRRSTRATRRRSSSSRQRAPARSSGTPRATSGPRRPVTARGVGAP